ncbi:MAG: SPFH domain-containing protein, partial [Pseudomonadota bacterium]|nr:SPFH domain-containing protein [Pseudomonadota bacterium]
MGKIGIGFVGILAVALLVLSGSVFTVKETQQVLVLQFGDVKGRVTDPGLHFKIPFVQQLRVFEKRILNVDPPAEEVLLADQKRLVVDTFARYRISDMLKYYQTLSTETAAVQRMNNIINASLRGVL